MPTHQLSPSILAVPGAKPELRVFGALLLLCNLPLLWGSLAEGLVLLPARVPEGEWWRLLTHPLVHVSGYHLLLDGIAFGLLYDGLRAPTAGGRLAYLAGAWAGSAALPLLVAPQVAQVGLCGLSGVDHGLMVASALECWGSPDPAERRSGALFLGAVVVKSALELATGQAFFSSLHFGLMGVPVVACHLGGVLGALVAHGLSRARSGQAGGMEDVH